jgi:excisionase family DNA binding protein
MSDKFEAGPAGARGCTIIPELVDAEWVAERLGMKKQRLYELVRADAIPHIRFGRTVRFIPARVAAWLESGGTSNDGRAA